MWKKNCTLDTSEHELRYGYTTFTEYAVQAQTHAGHCRLRNLGTPSQAESANYSHKEECCDGRQVITPCSACI